MSATIDTYLFDLASLRNCKYSMHLVRKTIYVRTLLRLCSVRTIFLPINRGEFLIFEHRFCSHHVQTNAPRKIQQPNLGFEFPMTDMSNTLAIRQPSCVKVTRGAQYFPFTSYKSASAVFNVIFRLEVMSL